MKTIFCTTILLFFLAGRTTAQKPAVIPVPSTVKTAFIRKFPRAEKVHWTRKENNYKASWGKEQSITFTPSGKFIEETDPLAVSKLPQAAVKYIHMTYRSPIVAAGKVTDREGKSAYVADVAGRDLLFDGTGRFIKAAKP